MKWSARCIFLSVGVYVEWSAICSLKCGWYVVTKGRIFFHTSLFFCKADFCLVNLPSEVIFFEVVDFVIEGLSWGVSFEKSKGFALYETFSDPVRVVGREMRTFKSLCRFKMCADVEDSLVVKSLAFVNRKRENCLKYWKKRTTIL